MEIRSVRLDKPEDVNVILGQAHFIKTVEDLHETLVTAMPGLRFGLAFCESSGPCLVRHSGSDPELTRLAREQALRLGAGHVFLIALRGAYPINVLNAIKGVQEVCRIFCATANPLEVVVAETAEGRGVLGVIDGQRPRGIEGEADAAARHDLLRKIGYKL